MVVVFSVLTVLVRSETGLLCKGATAGGWDLWKKLRLVGVMVGVMVVVASLPAGLSTMSTFRVVGGEAALPVAGEAALPVAGETDLPVAGEAALPVAGEADLPVAGEAAGGLTSFREGSGGSEE